MKLTGLLSATIFGVYTLGRVEKQALNSQNRGYQWKLTETVISAPISLNWEEWTSDLLSTRHGILPHWHRWTILWSESCHLWLKTHKQREQTPLGSTILAVIHVEGVLIDVVTTPMLTYEPKYISSVYNNKNDCCVIWFWLAQCQCSLANCDLWSH